mmetsp:Transcript_58560/g.186678  ORF Transcript_58560/g.186678 Transcript_58560/m.186678 type:complete len:254 (-) Transcript_58560:1123-1884(-)
MSSSVYVRANLGYGSSSSNGRVMLSWMITGMQPATHAKASRSPKPAPRPEGAKQKSAEVMARRILSPEEYFFLSSSFRLLVPSELVEMIAKSSSVSARSHTFLRIWRANALMTEQVPLKKSFGPGSRIPGAASHAGTSQRSEDLGGATTSLDGSWHVVLFRSFSIGSPLAFCHFSSSWCQLRPRCETIITCLSTPSTAHPPRSLLTNTTWSRPPRLRQKGNVASTYCTSCLMCLHVASPKKRQWEDQRRSVGM